MMTILEKLVFHFPSLKSSFFSHLKTCFSFRYKDSETIVKIDQKTATYNNGMHLHLSVCRSHPQSKWWWWWKKEWYFDCWMFVVSWSFLISISMIIIMPLTYVFIYKCACVVSYLAKNKWTHIHSQIQDGHSMLLFEDG